VAIVPKKHWAVKLLDLSGIGVTGETWSFPRKRESTPQTLGTVLSSEWIPAFAGMTGGTRGIPIPNDTSTDTSTDLSCCRG
jgi:hypothetical protein